MKGHRTEIDVCDVDVATEAPQGEQQETSNRATAEDLGLSSDGSDAPELGLVDLDRTIAADALYCEALPILEDLATSPQVEALGQAPAAQSDGLEEDAPCEDAGFEELPASRPCTRRLVASSSWARRALALTGALWLAGTLAWAVAAGPWVVERWHLDDPAPLAAEALAAGGRPRGALVRLEGVRVDEAAARRVDVSPDRHQHVRRWRTPALHPTTGVPLATLVSTDRVRADTPLVGTWREASGGLPEVHLDEMVGGGVVVEALLGLACCWFPAGLAGWFAWGIRRGGRPADDPSSKACSRS